MQSKCSTTEQTVSVLLNFFKTSSRNVTSYIYVSNYFRFKLQLCLLYSKGDITTYGLYSHITSVIMWGGEKTIYSKLLIEYLQNDRSTVTGMLHKISVFHFHNKVFLSDYHVSFIIKKATGLPKVLLICPTFKNQYAYVILHVQAR